jgi:hypothetical protein
MPRWQFLDGEKMKLSDDARSASISVDGDYSAEKLETLLVQLMSLRGQMRPSVSAMPNMEDESSLISCQEDGGFALSTSSDARTRLFLRHSGLGWLAFTFGQEHAALLRDYLVANTPNDQPVNLISEERGSRGTVQ